MTNKWQIWALNNIAIISIGLVWLVRRLVRDFRSEVANLVAWHPVVYTEYIPIVYEIPAALLVLPGSFSATEHFGSFTQSPLFSPFAKPKYQVKPLIFSQPISGFCGFLWSEEKNFSSSTSTWYIIYTFERANQRAIFWFSLAWQPTNHEAQTTAALVGCQFDFLYGLKLPFREDLEY